jgi:hypothetical protein
LAYSNALSAYRETRIRTASQGQLIVMLYDEAVKQLDIALEMIASAKRKPNSIEKINKAVVKTQEIITELMASLDFEVGGEIARTSSPSTTGSTENCSSRTSPGRSPHPGGSRHDERSQVRMAGDNRQVDS